MKNPLAYIKQYLDQRDKDARFHKLLEARSYDATDDYWYFPVPTPSKTGVDVSETTALKNAVVWGCVRVISETIASLPLNIYRRLGDGGKDRSPDHPLYKLLHLQPNPNMTAFSWREVMMSHILTWGNHYSYLDWARNGKLMGIWPLRPDRMEVDLTEDEKLIYEYRPTDGSPKVTYEPWEILHVPGLGFNGVTGYSVISMAREAVGISMASEELGARFFSNDATPPLVLKHPGRLSTDAHQRLKDSWMTSHAGIGNKWKPAILEEGMVPETLGVPYKDAQWLETRNFQVSEICRFYRVPPHMVQDLTRATFSNIEQQSLDFVVNCIRPWLVRLEQVFQIKLFADLSMDEYFCEHVIDGLLRGDIQSRYNAYAVGRQWGWLSADDVRALENMNPLPDGQGKIYLVPMNMIPADKAEDVAEAQLKPKEVPANAVQGEEEGEGEEVGKEMMNKIRDAYATLFTDAVSRILRRERIAIQRAYAKKDETSIRSDLDEFYRELPEFISTTLTPTLTSYATLVGSTETIQALRRYIQGHIEESRSEISKWNGESIDDNLNLWVETRPRYNAGVIQSFFHATT